MMEIAEIIDDPDFRVDFSVIRVTGALSTVGLTAGEYVRSNSTIATGGVVDHNIPPDRLLVLPEGVRSHQAILVFTRTELFAEDGDDPDNNTVDHISHNGQLYKVSFLRSWQEFGFWEAICTRSKRSPLGDPV
jgi:hypothetical protein